MSTIWIREFVGGLDTRRMPETTSGGVLIRATDGHINRGGEFEKRGAFVRTYDLPAAATIGLAAGKSDLFVFGHAAPPAMPAGVRYQRLQHPDGTTALTRVLSYDLYAGKIYVVGEFADGSRHHFYDGVRVPDWYDGRARASFRVVAGGTTPALAATGSFEVVAGTNNPGVNRFTNITIDGVAIISGPVDHTGNNATTASAIAAAINGFTSSPDYTASASGQTVTITAAATGTAANGKTIVVSVGGDAQAANINNMAGGADIATATLSSLAIDGVSVISSPIVWASSNTDTASAIAAAINSTASTPDYSAVANGETVSIVADAAGSNANGRVVAFGLANGFQVDPSAGLVMANGSNPVPASQATGSFTITGGTAAAGNQVTNITINGSAIISGAVLWATSNAATASAVAAAINSYVSSPDYTATASGAVVTVKAVNTGPAINGASINVTVGGNVTVGSVQAMAGGADAEATFVPGTFVKTIGSRMHSVSGANEHFSGIKAPTRWTTETTGAGFIDMSTEASGSETLTGLAKYQQFVAVFAQRLIQIWYFDSDPTLNEQKQVLNNTGTDCPRSITQFGDNDLFYVDESGVRSLRARDASNAAATTDIGVPIDTLVSDIMSGLSPEERVKVIGVIEPRDGRFWVSFQDRIFVFSFFQGAKISAWSLYLPSEEVDGESVPLTVDDMVVFRRRVYIRSGDAVYVYGGLGNDIEYDSTQAEVWLPFLDGDTPAREKVLNGVDVAATGVWEVRVAMNVNDIDASDKIATITETTYGLPKIGGEGTSTHFSLRFKSVGSGPARLGSAAIHYGPDEDED